MFKNTAGQIWVVFAFQDEGGANPGEPVTGDAANITANLRLDGGAANAVDDTNPAELEDGQYFFTITQAESNADNISIAPASATANVNVIGMPGALYTTTDMSAVEGKIDTADAAIDVAVADLANATDGLGAIKTAVDAIPTTAMRGTDSAATATALATAQSDLDILTGSDGATLATAQGNYAPAVAGDSMDVLSISGSTAAADNLEASALLMKSGACTATTLGNAAFSTNLTETTNDHYKGRVIIFTSGALIDQAADITAYTGSTKLITVTQMTEAPSDADTFLII